jgi:hypothetical protein
VSEHLGSTPRQLRLIGSDGQPGLLGGPTPESEPLVVRFVGADRPGAHTATLRIVTQAANLGVLSSMLPDEPPVNLYYVDVPVTVRVADKR